jgi:hypothetical protein
MEEAYLLSQTFQITPGQLVTIVRERTGLPHTLKEEEGKEGEGGEGEQKMAGKEMEGVDMGVLKYSTSDPNSSGYKMSIAIELRPERDCDHYDLLMGSFVERRQNLQLIRYAPPYYLDEGTAPAPEKEKS